MKVTRVTRITTSEPVPVYDLTVPDTENFLLAAGVFVHNSKDVADAVTGALYSMRRTRLTRSEVGVVDTGGRPIRDNGEDRYDVPRPR